jgi:uncharacterized protein YjbJ (UPF0337 family)
MKGAVKQRWGKLTDDDLTRINGDQGSKGLFRNDTESPRTRTRKQIDARYQNQSRQQGAFTRRKRWAPRCWCLRYSACASRRDHGASHASPCERQRTLTQRLGGTIVGQTVAASFSVGSSSLRAALLSKRHYFAPARGTPRMFEASRRAARLLSACVREDRNPAGFLRRASDAQPRLPGIHSRAIENRRSRESDRRGRSFLPRLELRGVDGVLLMRSGRLLGRRRPACRRSRSDSVLKSGVRVLIGEDDSPTAMMSEANPSRVARWLSTSASSFSGPRSGFGRSVWVFLARRRFAPKTPPMSVDCLGFPWILSCESRLINRLRGLKRG